MAASAVSLPTRPARATRPAAMPGSALPADGSVFPACRKRSARPVRLTRRGRLVVLAALVVLAIGLAALAAAPGEAAAPAGAAPTTVVRPGDTLWSVAVRTLPGRDRFRAIDEIRRLNGITDYTIHPGERLILPRTR